MAFGFLNVNKPAGPTSHDIVAAIRRESGERRVGHAGTLDPLAEGVLVVAVGQATRLLEYATQSSKHYVTEIELGAETNTYDVEGEVVARAAIPSNLTEDFLKRALLDFTGEFLQTPPVYSAIKVRGKSAHSRVRAGEDVKLAPRLVAIDEIAVQSIKLPFITLSVRCSPGTYIRSLAHDLGKALGCGATLRRLTRVASGKFQLEDSVPFTVLNSAFKDGSWESWLLPAEFVLSELPRVDLDEVHTAAIRNGLPISGHTLARGLARAYSFRGGFMAILMADPEQAMWRPVKVFEEQNIATPIK